MMKYINLLLICIALMGLGKILDNLTGLNLFTFWGGMVYYAVSFDRTYPLISD